MRRRLPGGRPSGVHRLPRGQPAQVEGGGASQAVCSPRFTTYELPFGVTVLGAKKAQEWHLLSPSTWKQTPGLGCCLLLLQLVVGSLGPCSARDRAFPGEGEEGHACPPARPPCSSGCSPGPPGGLTLKSVRTELCIIPEAFARGRKVTLVYFSSLIISAFNLAHQNPLALGCQCIDFQQHKRPKSESDLLLLLISERRKPHRLAL